MCYPHRSLQQAVDEMWDMNYFEYHVIELLAAPFNERRLEQDFNIRPILLLEAGQNYFLYRDFQTANVMVVGEEPWFIDYQGGRKGAPQYDVASMLYDAKIPMSETDRESLLGYYIENFCSDTKEDHHKFRGYYSGFSMIRVMQATWGFWIQGIV